MARRLRIQYPGAIYHLMARGNGRQDIVCDDADRDRLQQELGRAAVRWDGKGGTEKGSGAVSRPLSRSASGAEHRLQTEPGRHRCLPRLRPERLAPLDAPKDRFLLARAKRPVDPSRPIPRPLDRPRSQCGSLRRVLRPARLEAPPLPVLCPLHQVGPQSVSLDIAAHRQEMLVRLHGEGLEPPLIEVSGTGRPVVGVPALGMCHGEPAHKAGEVAVLARPEQEMEVVGHQAVSQQSHVVAGDCLGQNSLERCIVTVIVKDGRARVGSVEGMIDESAFSRSWWS
jgi:hypothetical protein